MPLPTAAGTPSPPQSPRKDFCRAKMPCGGERLLDLLLGSLIVERIAYQIAAAIQNESAGKNRRSLPQWLDTSCLEPMGFHKGPQTLVLCCAASATTAISSRRLDTALLCAAKKRGVEKGPAGGYRQQSHWRLPPRTAETYSSSCSGSTRSIEMTRLPSSTLMRMTPCVSRL